MRTPIRAVAAVAAVVALCGLLPGTASAAGYQDLGQRCASGPSARVCAAVRLFDDGRTLEAVGTVQGSGRATICLTRVEVMEIRGTSVSTGYHRCVTSGSTSGESLPRLSVGCPYQAGYTARVDYTVNGQQKPAVYSTNVPFDC